MSPTITNGELVGNFKSESFFMLHFQISCPTQGSQADGSNKQRTLALWDKNHQHRVSLLLVVVVLTHSLCTRDAHVKIVRWSIIPTKCSPFSSSEEKGYFVLLSIWLMWAAGAKLSWIWRYVTRMAERDIPYLCDQAMWWILNQMSTVPSTYTLFIIATKCSTCAM